MSSSCLIENNTPNRVYMDVYRVNKWGGGPPTHSTGLTWDDLGPRLEADGFRECPPGGVRQAPPGALSWPLHFGGYEIKERDSWGRPILLEVFEGSCKTGYWHGEVAKYPLTDRSHKTHTIHLCVPPVNTRNIRDRFAPSVSDVDVRDVAAQVKLAAEVAVGLAATYAFVRNAFWPSRPPAADPPRGTQAEYEIHEFVGDDDNMVVTRAPRPSQRSQARISL
ncbi:hypothetical protein KCU95_g12844, partial [Aureobasidium melanogenum]